MIALKTILIIEDDRAINNLIKGTLSAEGYVCDCAFDGREGANLLEEKRYDLVLLDLMLPEIGGYELLEYIHPMGIPAIVISAMGRVEDRIRGLRMGADDYLCKPFQIGELLARVESVLRRTGAPAQKLQIGDVTIDPESRQVWKAGEPVELTVKEFDLLLELVRHKNVASAARRCMRSSGRRNIPARRGRWIRTSSACAGSSTGTTASRRCSASATGWRCAGEVFSQAVF